MAANNRHVADFQSLTTAILHEQAAALAVVDPDEVAGLRQAILRAPRIFLAGRGRTGLQMQAFAMRLMHLALPVCVVGEVTTPGIGSGDLLLVGSASGRTASLAQYAARAHDLGANVALITAASDGPISELAAYRVCLPAPTPKLAASSASHSVQPLGSLFEGALGLLFDVLVLQLMDERGMSADQMFARHANLE